LLFLDPSPSLLVAAVVAYHLAFHRMHIALLSRSKFHIHILVVGGIAGLLLAYVGGFDMLDAGLIVAPMAVNMSLLFSYLAGMLWGVAASLPSEDGVLHKNDASRGKEAWSSAC
jgi:hypothetical protein